MQWILILIAAGLLTGCASYPKYDPQAGSGTNSVTRSPPADHWLYAIAPRYREDLVCPLQYFTWSLLGNEDDGMFNEDQTNGLPKTVGLKDAVKWYARNPLHNFTFYTVGTVGNPEHLNLTLFAADNDGVRALKLNGESYVFKEKWSFQIALNDGIPFIAWKIPYQLFGGKKRQFDGYFGRRPFGAIGFKFRPGMEYSESR